MAYSQTYQRETHTRTLKIMGVAITVSNQRGGLLIIGKPEYKGKQVTFEGWEGEVGYGTKITQGFTLRNIKGRMLCVAVFPKLVPGTYRLDSYISNHSSERVTITAGYVAQLDWT